MAALNLWQRWRQRYWIRQARKWMVEYQTTQDELDYITELEASCAGINPGSGANLYDNITLLTLYLGQLDDKRPAWLTLPNGASPMPVLTQATAIPSIVLDMEYRLKDALYVLCQHTKRSNKTDFMKLKDDLDRGYAELHEVLDTKPVLNLQQGPLVTAVAVAYNRAQGDIAQAIKVAVSDGMLEHEQQRTCNDLLLALANLLKANPVADNATLDLTGLPKQAASDLDIVSIQMQTTRLTGAGVEMVSFKDQHNTPTHWSIYKRLRNGQAVWIEDISLGGKCSGNTYSEALIKAGKYSMAYKAFIEEPF